MGLFSNQTLLFTMIFVNFFSFSLYLPWTLHQPLQKFRLPTIVDFFFTFDLYPFDYYFFLIIYKITNIFFNLTPIFFKTINNLSNYKCFFLISTLYDFFFKFGHCSFYYYFLFEIIFIFFSNFIVFEFFSIKFYHLLFITIFFLFSQVFLSIFFLWFHHSKLNWLKFMFFDWIWVQDFTGCKFWRLNQV